MILHLSKKIVKKYKIWPPKIFYCEDHVERFGLIVRTLKTEINDIEHIGAQNEGAFFYVLSFLFSQTVR